MWPVLFFLRNIYIYIYIYYNSILIRSQSNKWCLAGQIWREIRVSLVKCKSWTRTSIKITSYPGTDSGSSREKPDEVKMVLYSRGVWNACFHWLFTKRQMSIRTARSPAFYLFFLRFGRGTSVARRDHGGGLALLESSRGYCRSWYDTEITRNRQWRQHITEDLPDASKMYDWNVSANFLCFLFLHCLSLN